MARGSGPREVERTDASSSRVDTPLVATPAVMSPEPDEPAGLPLFDQRNYRRAKATLPGHGQGIAPRNKGKTLPAEIIPAEQVRALVDACPKTTPYGLR